MGVFPFAGTRGQLHLGQHPFMSRNGGETLLCQDIAFDLPNLLSI